MKNDNEGATLVSAPHVDIYVLSYKRPHYVAKLLESLVEMQYPTLDVTVIDNSSSVDTRIVVQQFVERHSNVHLKCFEDSGLNRVNVALLWSNSKYIFMPHDDDLVDSNWVMRAVTKLESNPSLSAVFSSWVVIDTEGNPVNSKPVRYRTGITTVGQFAPHFVKTGELPLVATGVFRLSTLVENDIKFGSPKDIGVALDVQILRDINAVSCFYCDDYVGYYYRSHNNQTAIEKGQETACSAAYIISTHYNDDWCLQQKMLQTIADLVICYRKKPTPLLLRLVLRLVRYVCRRNVYMPPKVIWSLIVSLRPFLRDIFLAS
jgi:glycosyltransferase involved in cell wall biosynthesis